MEKLIRMRRAAGAAVVDGAFRGISMSSSLIPPSWPSWHDVQRVRSVRYHSSSNAAHLLDIYMPPPEFRGPRPVVVYLHGGGFRILSDKAI
jgi:acetyl esterase